MNVSNYSNPYQSAGRIVGVIDILLGAVTYVLYIPTIYIICTSKKLWKQSAFKLMGVMGIFDMLTLTTGSFYMGALTLYPQLKFKIPLLMDNLVSATFICGHAIYLMLAHSLAFNRFIFMAFGSYVHVFFDGNRLWIWIVANCFCGIVPLCVYMTPFASLQFDTQSGMFMHPPGYAWNTQMLTCLRVGIITNLAGIIIWYTLTVTFVVCKRNAVRSMTLRSWKKEVLISVQAFLIGGMLAQCWTLWLFISFLGSHTYYLCNIDCILLSGMNAPIYLAFNTTIRKEYLLLLGISSRSQKNTTAPTSSYVSDRRYKPRSVEEESKTPPFQMLFLE